jgi:hypothetical protein
MINKLILIGSMLIAVAMASSCSHQQSGSAAHFGEAVRNVTANQIHDDDAAVHPTIGAIEGADPDRLNTVLEAYRGDVGEAKEIQEPINVNVGR